MFTKNCALFKKSFSAIALSLVFQTPFALAMEKEQNESALSNAVLPADCLEIIICNSDLNTRINGWSGTCSELRHFSLGTILDIDELFMENIINLNLPLFRNLKVLDSCKNSVIENYIHSSLIDALANNNLGMAEFLLNIAGELSYLGSTFNARALHFAAKENDLEMAEFLLNNFEDKFKVDKKSIKFPFEGALRNDNTEMVTFLLNLPEGYPKLDQYDINWAFAYWAGTEMQTFLLNLPEGNFKPDQAGIDLAFKINASCFNLSSVLRGRGLSPILFANRTFYERSLEKVTYILHLPEGNPRPSQGAINSNFDFAIKSRCNIGYLQDINNFFNISHDDYFGILRLLLTPPEGNFSPTQNVIDNAFRECMGDYYTGRRFDTTSDLVELLLPFASQEERENQADAIRDWHIPQMQVINNAAMMPQNQVPIQHIRNRVEQGTDIHGYAAASVNVAERGVGVKKNLLDAVFQNMSSRVSPDNLLSYEAAVGIINEAVDMYILVDQQEKARKAIFFKLQVDDDCERQLSLVVSFIQQHHPEAMVTWIEGFVRESIIAYSRGDTISCAPGIKDRIATGLRTVDAELDQLFAQPEAKMLVTNYISSWYPFVEGWTTKLAKQLVDGGFTSQSTFKNAVDSLRKVLEKEIENYGFTIKDYNGEIEAIAGAIEDNFEDIQIAAAQIMANKK